MLHRWPAGRETGAKAGTGGQRYSKETRDARGDATVGESQGQNGSAQARAEVRESDESKSKRDRAGKAGT